jgi:hypothetical protein
VIADFAERGSAAQKAVDVEIAAVNKRLARKPRRTPDDMQAELRNRKAT